MTTVRARRRGSLWRWGAGALGGALVLTGCSKASPANSGSTTTTGTLPPLPPNVVAYVALAGPTASVGTGAKVVEVTVSPPPESVGSTVKVGSYPDAVAVAPGGRLALVANYNSNTVTPIVIPSNQVLPAIDAGQGPVAIAIAPNGKTAYVSDANGNVVTPINLITMKPGTPIAVGNGPQGIAITPDGSKAYVADAGAIVAGQSGTIGHDVTPIDLSTGRALAAIPVGNAPVGVAVSPDGSTVFVTNLNSESVTPITVSTDQPGSPVATAGGPVAVIVAANAAWVVNTPAGGQGNNVQPISLANDVAGAPILMPKGAQNIAVAPNGKTAWVVCLNSNRLVPVDLVTRKAGRGIVVRGGPFAVAVATQPKGPPPATTTTVAKKNKKKTTSTT